MSGRHLFVYVFLPGAPEGRGKRYGITYPIPDEWDSFTDEVKAVWVRRWADEHLKTFAKVGASTVEGSGGDVVHLEKWKATVVVEELEKEE